MTQRCRRALLAALLVFVLLLASGSSDAVSPPPQAAAAAAAAAARAEPAATAARVVAASGGGGAQPTAAAADVAAPDPVAVVERLAECLYGRNDLGADCIPALCSPAVTVHGDGVWLPRAPFAGVRWVTDVHRELFSSYREWRHAFIDVAATPGAARGLSEVLGFFAWSANNTGPYHGLAPTRRRSRDYGVLRAAVDRSGRVTDVTLWRGGFAEERAGLLVDPGRDDAIGACPDVTRRPFWIPSQSLQLRMLARAHALVEVLNQGPEALDALDDIAAPDVALLDGMGIWGPKPRADGLAALKLWLAGWLQRYQQLTLAVTAAAATPTSNKVILCFRMLLTLSGGDVDDDGSTNDGGAAASAAAAAAAGGVNDAARGRGGGGREERRAAAAAAAGATPGAGAAGAKRATMATATAAAAAATQQVDGCLLFVFSLQGDITHVVVWRNGTPEEMADAFIGGRGASAVDGAADGAADGADAADPAAQTVVVEE